MEDTAERKSGFAIRRSREYLHDMMHEGNSLAGVFVFTFGGKYWFMHGATSTEKRIYNPNHLPRWEVARWAKEQSIEYYDMVGIPKARNLREDDPYYGVYRFMIGFGGKVTDFVGCLALPLKKTPARKPGTRSSQHTTVSTTSSRATSSIGTL